MAEGMVAMAEESTDEAIQHFELVLSLEQETDDQELLSIANFWKGRCLRMKGEYDQALAFAVKGRDLAWKPGHPPMAAVMRVLESWLFFQKGNANHALQILQAAEAILRKTDDYLTLGNIHSSYGRIARRQGRYQHAIESFTTASGQKPGSFKMLSRQVQLRFIAKRKRIASPLSSTCTTFGRSR